MIRGRVSILVLLTGLNLLNYIDRYVIVAVSPKIRADFGLSYKQTGLVMSAFMMGYMLTSPIFGPIGDKHRRKYWIAGAVALWSVATAYTGLVASFAMLIAARVAVGVGEASYATISPTIIDDITPEGTKNRYLSIFYVAIPVGSALGFLTGGAVEARFGWRSACFVAGGPGVVFALLTLLIVEPARRVRSALDAAPAAGWARYLPLLRSRTYVLTVAGFVAHTFALGGFTAWAPTYLYERHCMALEPANFWFGIVTVVTGLGGTAIGGVLGDRWPGADRIRAQLRVCCWATVAAVPLAAAALFTTTQLWFFVLLGACELGLFITVSPINAAVLGSVPTYLRATAMAASIFAIHALGDVISPTLIGAVSDAVSSPSPTQCSGGAGLQTGMIMLPFALAVAAAIWGVASRQAAAQR